MQRLECERMFVAVMETGSFAKAAARLGTGSAQASKLVSRLESDLGVRLLNRTTRSLSPTEVGQAYLERIKVVLEELDALDEAVKNRSGSASGRLRLTVPMSFGTTQLAPAFIDFATRFPDIDLDVSFSDRVVNLVDEGFDAAVRIGTPADTSLIARKLCGARIVLAASADYLSQRGTPETPADLAGHDCIIDSNFRDPLVWHFRTDRSGEANMVKVVGRLRFSSADACLSAAEAGLGIARVPSFMAGPRIRAGRLKPLLRAFEDQALGIFVLYPPNRHLATKVRVFVDFLVQRFQGEPAWDQGW
ncbi:MAG: LysR family transcriptional regulator [Aestuariivirga sp.]